MKWSVDRETTRIRFRLFLVPTLVGDYWYWLHPGYVREVYESGWGGSDWVVSEILPDSLDIPI